MQTENQNPLPINFSKITPQNIDQVLDVNHEFDFHTARIGEFFLKKTQWGYIAVLGFDATIPDPYGIRGVGVGSYNCSFEVSEKNQFKVHQNGTSNYHHFDNLEGVLNYLLKGDYYQGESFKRTEALIIKTAQGQDILYNNPF